MSVPLQALAAFFALRLIPVSGRRLAWIILCFAFVLMMGRRLIGLLYETGVIEDPATMKVIAESMALTISVLLMSGLYLIRGIFVDLAQARAKLHEQLDELRRFQQVAVGRELRMQQLEDECAALRAARGGATPPT